MVARRQCHYLIPVLKLEITMSNESKVCDCNQGRMPCTCKTSEPGAGYTAVDMTTAAAQGFRDGAASVVVDLPEVMKTRPFQTIDRGSDNFKAGFNMAIRLSGAAILAAGGTVKE